MILDLLQYFLGVFWNLTKNHQIWQSRPCICYKKIWGHLWKYYFHIWDSENVKKSEGLGSVVCWFFLFLRFPDTSFIVKFGKTGTEQIWRSSWTILPNHGYEFDIYQKPWSGNLVIFLFSSKGIPSTPQHSDSHPCTSRGSMVRHKLIGGDSRSWPPRGWSGAGVGISMLRGAVDSLTWKYWFLDFWFLGFKVSWFRSSKDPTLPTISYFLEDNDPISKIFEKFQDGSSCFVGEFPKLQKMISDISRVENHVFKNDLGFFLGFFEVSRGLRR